MKNKKTLGLLLSSILVVSILLIGCGHCPLSKKSCCDKKDMKCEHAHKDDAKPAAPEAPVEKK